MPRRTLRRFAAISRAELAHFAEAAIALALASAAIRLLPFRALVRTMGQGMAKRSRAAGADIDTKVTQAVRRASRRLPWKTVCFHEGLAAHWMLRRRGAPSRVHYGLRPGSSGLSAHVWVTVGDRTVIGEETSDPHVCVAVFPQS